MQSQLKENKLGVTIILIPHNNADRFKVRLDRDVLPTILAHPTWKFQLIIVDNSDEDKKPLYNIPDGGNIEHVNVWPGKNIMYGPAMNLAIEIARHPYLIYVCSNHGRMYHPTWIDDLVNPMIEDPKVAMTGSLYGSGNPADMGFSTHLPHIHIQGGVFGASTKVLTAYPYTTDDRWVHWGSDVFQCFQLMSAGFTLHNVQSVNSVWRERVDSPEKWKYVHDYLEG